MNYEIDNSCMTQNGFSLSSWQSDEFGKVVVYHKEPFRKSWFFTKLATFVYIIDGTPKNYLQIDRNYDLLSAYARVHKKSVLPRSFQLGYALLPIYIGQDFDNDLKQDVKREHLKKWAMFHVPSLYDMATGSLTTLETRMIWGCIYAGFISKTINDAVSGIKIGGISGNR